MIESEPDLDTQRTTSRLEAVRVLNSPIDRSLPRHLWTKPEESLICNVGSTGRWDTHESAVLRSDVVAIEPMPHIHCGQTVYGQPSDKFNLRSLTSRSAHTYIIENHESLIPALTARYSEQDRQPRGASPLATSYEPSEPLRRHLPPRLGRRTTTRTFLLPSHTLRHAFAPRWCLLSRHARTAWFACDLALLGLEFVLHVIVSSAHIKPIRGEVENTRNTS